MVNEYPLITAGNLLASFTGKFVSCCIGVLLHGGYHVFSGLQLLVSPCVSGMLGSRIGLLGYPSLWPSGLT